MEKFIEEFIDELHRGEERGGVAGLQSHQNLRMSGERELQFYWYSRTVIFKYSGNSIYSLNQ